MGGNINGSGVIRLLVTDNRWGVIRLSLAGLLLCVGLGACSTSTKHLTTLSLGMTQPDVTQALGHPHTARGSIKNRFGQTVEVWEYVLNKPRTGSQVAAGATLTVLTFGLAAPVLLAPGKEAAFWLYFVDGKLGRWGQAGDWSKEADRIYEIRFDPPARLAR